MEGQKRGKELQRFPVIKRKREEIGKGSGEKAEVGGKEIGGTRMSEGKRTSKKEWKV